VQKSAFFCGFSVFFCGKSSLILAFLKMEILGILPGLQAAAGMCREKFFLLVRTEIFWQPRR
jgi:hypothetical protein